MSEEYARLHAIEHPEEEEEEEEVATDQSVSYENYPSLIKTYTKYEDNDITQAVYFMHFLPHGVLVI